STPRQEGVREPLLQMAVQILKRHRDVTFEGRDDGPISIINTTLAGHAYSAFTCRIHAETGSWNDLLRVELRKAETLRSGLSAAKRPEHAKRAKAHQRPGGRLGNGEDLAADFAARESAGAAGMDVCVERPDLQPVKLLGAQCCRGPRQS